MMFFTLLLEVIWILAAFGGHHWTYEGPHGQQTWPASYPECGSNAQSPINIKTDSVTFDAELPPLHLHGYDHPGTKSLELHNNGHTVQLSLPPTLYLEGLPRKYVAAQLHLHWGQKGFPRGSEHQINSEATAAELHIVHYDSDSYNSLSEAAQRPQGLAVLGILIEVGETKNPAYEHILSHLHEIRYKDQNTSVLPFSLRELLPPMLAQFFRYNGSLTTPPCYQSVLWTVFHRRAQISMGQLEKLQETLFSTEDPSKLLVQNYRVPQPLNQRKVFASFIQAEPVYTRGEMLNLGIGILVGCLCLLLAVYFIAKKIRPLCLETCTVQNWRWRNTERGDQGSTPGTGVPRPGSLNPRVGCAGQNTPSPDCPPAVGLQRGREVSLGQGEGRPLTHGKSWITKGSPDGGDKCRLKPTSHRLAEPRLLLVKPKGHQWTKQNPEGGGTD